MNGFDDSFLTKLPETILDVSGLILNNFVLFVVVAIVALEISRRLTRYGSLIAGIMIVTAALYTTGATAYLVS